MEFIALGIGFLLLMVGVWGIITQKNMIKMIIGFSIFDTGIHIIMVAIGFIRGKSAPIIDSDLPLSSSALGMVDPVPQALVLTAIVIGLGVTALMLVFVLKLHDKKKTLDISKYKDLRW